MERKFLEGLGLDKETVEKVMAEHGKTVEQQKLLTTAAEKDRDTYKGQLDTVNTQLKAFEGVDVAKLQGEIQKLQGDLTTQQATHAAEIADRDFQGNLSAAIAAAKGKNTKAIMALLEEKADALKASKNQKEDIAEALKALRESDAYLFDGDGKPNDSTPARVSTGGAHNETGDQTNTDTNALMNNFIKGAVKGE
ncbi:phage scaffolding protein [Eubacteriales bacterium OttesenSCG-928-A19]|nr:phage scaffolding protein [Eubacteriales bacterium OttesenSCG-928-A19]